MISVSQALGAQRKEALSLLFGHISGSERDEHIAELLSADERGNFSLAGLFVAFFQDRIAGTILSLRQEDGCLYIWPPAVCGVSNQNDVTDALLRHVVDRSRTTGDWIVQCLIEPQAAGQRADLERNGFLHLTDLHYLQRRLSEPMPPCSVLPLVKTRLDPGRNETRFAAVIERTYQGTLDCPELDGLRSGTEAMAGHRSTGVFLPEQWTIFSDADADVGVQLFCEHPDQDAWELVYMGIVPAARGRGWGRLIVLDGLHEANAAGREAVLLAVDQRNQPALKLYGELGFRQTDVRSVHVCFPRKSNLTAIKKT
ncbi:MAG: GNAT family N-acetyltransferase [Planctomycetes bacterium]|nr:GNAT family N-acetyltransferase [Planctomycetota bacterium]